MDSDEFLAHYGVKGMKWGVTRRQPSSDHSESRVLKKKRNKELTNKELQTLNTRLQLESQRKKLDPNKVKKGHEVAKTILAVGTTVTSLYALSQTPLGKQIVENIKTKVG